MTTPSVIRFRCPTCGDTQLEERWIDCRYARVIDEFVQSSGCPRDELAAVASRDPDDEYVETGTLEEYGCASCSFSVKTLDELKPYLK
jgi:hypothetical protein